MLFLGKFLTWLASPLVMGVVMGWLAWRAAFQKRRRQSVGWLMLALIWLLVWTSPRFYAWFGGSLEDLYPQQLAEELPAADAIVLLGGGMNASRALRDRPDMNSAADRLWLAARLYKAGKAPLIVPSGVGEDLAAVPLLVDLGVPASALRVDCASRNTAENAHYTAALLQRQQIGRRVLLVTSAWHMRRAQLLFERAGFTVIPAATDYEATIERTRVDCWSPAAWLPCPEALCRNTYILKEYIGYWVYRAGWGGM